MTKQLTIKKAQELIQKVLEKHGYSPDKEIPLMSEVLMHGVLRNSSQGFPKLFGWHIEKEDSAEEPEIDATAKTVNRINAKHNNGMYACKIALSKLQETLKNEPVCIAGVYNTYSSSGAIGHYTAELAKSGYVGIMVASADPIGGIGLKGSPKGVFGTNPIAISVPYKGEHITLDMSTAKYTWGDLVDHDINNKKLQPGFAYDKGGNPTTNPKAAMEGSVATFDGLYKGLGLAFMIQVLAGALVGSVYEQSDETCGYGDLIIGINADYLSGQEFIDQQVEKLIETYKNASGGNNISLPGERSAKTEQKNLQKGEVEISEDLYEKIISFTA